MSQCKDSKIGIMIHAYELQALSEKETERFELHLMECDYCYNELREFEKQAALLKSDLEVRKVISMSVEEQVKHESLWTRALDTLSDLDLTPGVRERINAWIVEASGKPEAIVNILIDSTKRNAKILQENIKALDLPSIPFSFSPVPVPTRVLGFEKKGSISVEAEGPPWVRVTVDPSSKKITVQSETIEEPWPLVILLPKEEGKVSIKEFYHPVDTDFLLAEFEEIPDGDYILLLRL